ncbi:MAG: ribonuclease III [Desertifilum sp.]|nr:ribonuclease III [Desertifilum sp.]
MPLPAFADEMLLRQALTHRSYVNENPGMGEEDNERLEFLGDALLTFLCGEYLFADRQKLAEDEMTRRRAALVDEEQLAKFAIAIGLNSQMRLGKGAVREGGTTNPKLLSSTFEAFIGAYYLDCGSNIEPVRELVRSLFASVPDSILESRANIDSKNRFQEWVQARIGPNPPRYQTHKAGGSDRTPIFVAIVFVNDKPYGEGRGHSKKEAEKAAAEDALGKLKKRGLL